jgi:hypothetical protein
VDEVRELNWIFDEKDWSIVSDHIIVTFLSIMLDSEAARITIAII